MLFILLVWLLAVIVDGAEKVTDGRLARKGEFPYAVAFKGTTICGGVLVATTKILTAGHCLFLKRTGKPIDIKYAYAVAGTLNSSMFNAADPERQRRDFASIQVHPKYKRKRDRTKYNDIALVFVVSPFILSETCALATFPANNEKDFMKAWEDVVASGETCVAAGWGKVGSNKTSGRSMLLKVATFKPKPSNECKTWYWKNDTDMSHTEICAIGNTDTEGICDGDSGGPFVCRGHVFALVKSGKCGDVITDQPTFFTLVGAYWTFVFEPSESSHLTENMLLILSLLLLSET